MDTQSPRPIESESPDDLLERAIASHQTLTVPAGPPSELVRATLRALERSEPVDSLPLKTMSRAKRLLATAASVVLAIAACVVVAVFLQTDSPTAFARMIEPILKAKTARFNVTMEFGGMTRVTTRMMILGDGHLRQELPDGQVQIINSETGKFLMLNPADRSAVLTSTTAMASHDRPPNYFDLLRTGLRSADHDPAVRRESQGEKQIDRRDVVGYRLMLNESNGEMTIWGDPKTGMPVAAEMKLAMLPDAHYTMSDFEFDVPLDASLFETNVPAGYHLIERTLSTPTEADLIAGLKLVADHNAGRFPDAFDVAAMSSLMASARPKPSGSSKSAGTEELLQRMKPFTQGLAFAATLPADAHARYAGKDVKLGDKGPAIFWYKPAGAAVYRVVHGDLSITEQNDAPKSPNAVPITFQFSMGKKLADVLKRHSRLPLPEPPPLPRPMAPETQADDPAARRVLDQTIKVYANCKSYRDTGVTTTHSHSKTRGDRTTEQIFATAFVRPERFRFEFTDRKTVGKDAPEDRKRRTIVWSDGMTVQVWSDAEKKIKNVEPLALALGGAFGISGGTSATIAGLLLPGEKIGGKLQLIKFPMGFTLLEEGQLGVHACHRVVGKWGNLPMTIWIDKQTHLVRRIDTSSQTADIQFEQTTIYEPIIDEEISADLLEFDPPEQD